MIGFTIIVLLLYMTFLLILNGLRTKEIEAGVKEFPETDVIVTPDSLEGNFTEAWVDSLKNFRSPPGKIHIHAQKGHSAVDWVMLQQRFPYVIIHEALEHLTSDRAVRLSGPASVVPTEESIKAMARVCQERAMTVLFLPQTAKTSVLGEAFECLNPGLALASIFPLKKRGFRKYHPLMAITEAWVGSPNPCTRDIQGAAFAGRGVQRAYPQGIEAHFSRNVNRWKEVLERPDKFPAGFYLMALLLWASPILLYPFKPLWAMASLLLVMAYRFFTKIIFQESWAAYFLHPLAVFFQLAAMIRALGLLRKNV